MDPAGMVLVRPGMRECLAVIKRVAAGLPMLVGLALVGGLLVTPPASAATSGLVPSPQALAAPYGSADPAPDLTAMACPSAAACAAVGSYADSAGTTDAVLLDETDGTSSRATEVQLPANATPAPGNPESTASAVACPAVGDCVAVGDYAAGDAGLQGFVDSEVAGVWGAATEVSPLPADAAVTDQDVSFSAIACPQVGDCVAVGQYGALGGGSYPLTLSETNGIWGIPVEVPLPPGQTGVPRGTLDAVSCSSVGECAAVGVSGAAGLMLSETDGVWSIPTAPSLPSDAVSPDSGLSSVACPVDGQCTAIGSYDVAAGTSTLTVSETNGTWSPATEIPPPSDAGGSVGPESGGLSQIACPSLGNCVAVGSYNELGHAGFRAMEASEADGIWGAAAPAPLPSDADAAGQSQLTTLSCASAGDCAAIGTYTTTEGLLDGFGISGTSDLLATSDGAQVGSSTGNGSARLSAVSCAPGGGCDSTGTFVDDQGSPQPVALAEGRSGPQFENTPSLPANAGAPAATGLAAVSCGAPGDCGAVGQYTSGTGEAMVVSRVGGAWQPPQEILTPSGPGAPAVSAALTQVSCPAAGTCTAVGHYLDGHDGQQGMVVTETNGLWSLTATEVQLPGGAQASSDADAPTVSFSSLSCPSAGNCVAVGQLQVNGTDPVAPEPLLLTETNGVWSSQSPAPPAADASDANAPVMILRSVSCASAGNCAAVGAVDHGSGYTAVELTESAGVWSAAAEVALPADAQTAEPQAQLTTVSCSAPNSCAAAGTYQASDDNDPPMLASDVDGTWQSIAAPLPAGAFSGPLTAGGDEPGGEIPSLSCGGTGQCGAVGLYDDSMDSYQLLLRTNGATWSADATEPVRGEASGPDGSIACPTADMCAAAGGPPADSDLSVYSSGAWTTPVAVPGVSSITAISCASASDCAAVAPATNPTRPEAVLVSVDPPSPAPATTPIPGSSATAVPAPVSTTPVRVTTVAAPTAPRTRSAPSIAGVLQAGRLLTARPGTWRGTGPLSYRYAWQRCTRSCVAIARAVGARYRLTSADTGTKIRVLVQARNAAGSATAFSARRGLILPAAASIRSLEVTLARPATTRIPALVSAGGYQRRFTTRADGNATVDWYQQTGRGRSVVSTLMASATVHFSVARPAVLKLALTRAGRLLLGRGRPLALTVSETLHLSGARATVYQRAIALMR